RLEAVTAIAGRASVMRGRPAAASAARPDWATRLDRAGIEWALTATDAEALRRRQWFEPRRVPGALYTANPLRAARELGAAVTGEPRLLLLPGRDELRRCEDIAGVLVVSPALAAIDRVASGG